MTPGTVYGCSKLQNVCTQVCFYSNFKDAQKNIIRSVIFFVIVSIVQREDIHMLCHN